MANLEDRAEQLLSDMIEHQRTKVVRRAREIMPDCTFEDIMNPDGIAAFRDDPTFHYEDGILAGLIAAQVALRARVFVPDRLGGAGDGPLPSLQD